MAAPIHDDSWDARVLALHAEIELPEGSKAEVIEGLIEVSPSPAGRHSLIQFRLQTQLMNLVPTGVAVATGVTLDMTKTGERYVPDLIAIEEKILETEKWLFDATSAILVAEIVSPHNARHDRVVKVRGYAECGVPVYLLVDPLEQATTLFYEPAGVCYRQAHRVPFGAALSLPEPYVGKIDTGVFARSGGPVGT